VNRSSDGKKEDRLPGSDIPLAELPAEEPRFVKMDCIAVNRVEDIPSGPDWTREVNGTAIGFAL
jgi:hypothetical protein